MCTSHKPGFSHYGVVRVNMSSEGKDISVPLVVDSNM